MTNTDNTIFTNIDENKLGNRINVLLERAKLLDIMVGYFRITGFHHIESNLQKIDKVRILVGLGVDRKTYENTLQSRDQGVFESIRKEIVSEFAESNDTTEIEQGVNQFVEWLKAGKIVIHMYPLKRIHAKLYIIKNDEELSKIQYGNVITGSSNLSEAGLESNIEFNVELKNKSDVKFAEVFFNDLWKDSVDITLRMIDVIERQTWMNNSVTPYEAYLKSLYEYFIEEISEDRITIHVPDGFMRLKYQEDAVIEAIKMLQKHGGVLISDVVGLGKTYVAAMMGKALKGRKLFIVPPVVKDTWEKVLGDFEYSRNDVVESLGMIEHLLNRDDIHDFNYVFVDEAHQFRNNESKRFQILKEICFNKKVILITATPHNNTIVDIAHLIELFQDPNHSSIMPNESNLTAYFNLLRARLLAAKNTPIYESELKKVSQEVRNDVLRHVMVRRTRNDIQTYYASDIKSQKLKFPETPDPEIVAYSYSDRMEANFNKTIDLIAQIKYARYAPLLYLNDVRIVNEKKSGQLNMIGFVKTMLVKRLESSIFAFRETIRRINNLNDTYLTAYENDRVVVGQFTKDRKNYNVASLNMMDDDQFTTLVLEANSQIYKKSDFSLEFYKDLKHDSKIFTSLLRLWADFEEKDDNKFNYLLEKIKLYRRCNSKLIIFSEAKDTVDYLSRRINELFPNETISFSGSDDESKRMKVKQYFDPTISFEAHNEIRILITTDALSEGINLHRANVIINYDLPWNPTRVMQRVGRINRVGTQFDVIHVLNFFPSTNAKDHLKLEDNIKSKVLVFQTLLGADAKLLTAEEEIESYGLFDSETAQLAQGEQIEDLYKSIKEGLKPDEEISFSTYKMEGLSLIRSIQKKDKALFDRIANLPPKLRIARFGNSDELLTFIKQGLVRKFYSNDREGKGIEVQFEYFIDRVKANVETQKKEMPNDYFKKLKSNLKQFDDDISFILQMNSRSAILSKSQNELNAMLKFIRNNIPHEDQIDYINQAIDLIRKGIINKAMARKIISRLTSAGSDPNKMYELLKTNIPEIYFSKRSTYEVIDLAEEDRVVVLSEYIISENGETK